MLDLVIRGGPVVTPRGVGEWEIGVHGEQIDRGGGDVGREDLEFKGAAISRRSLTALQSWRRVICLDDWAIASEEIWLPRGRERR